MQLVALLERAAHEPIRACVSMPPQHGKSVTAKAAIAWMAQRFPKRVNAYASYNQSLANRHSRDARRMAREAGVTLSNESSSVRDWRNEDNGGLIATGVKGELTGTGVSGVLIVDDPLKNRQEAESQLIRDAVWDWFTSSVFSRRHPQTSYVVIATRWHADDLTGRLIELGWEWLNLPALRDEDTDAPNDKGVPLWPERFSREFYAETRRVNEYDWASLYQGHPVPRGGRVFELADPPRFAKRAEDHARQVVLSVDAAGTENTRSDYTVFGALEFTGSGAEMVCNVVDVERYQLEPPDIAPKLLAFQRRHVAGGSIRIEASRDGIAIAKALKKLEPALSIVEVRPIGDKFTRAQPVRSAWNQGRVRLPQHAPWAADFLAELRSFTGAGDKHDDQVDMLSQGWNAAANAPRVQVRPDRESGGLGAPAAPRTQPAPIIAALPTRAQLTPGTGIDGARWTGRRGF